MTDEPTPPAIRTFGLNSREFYEAVTPPPDPWRWGPGLPREPRVWEQPFIAGVEWRDGEEFSEVPLRES